MKLVFKYPLLLIAIILAVACGAKSASENKVQKKDIPASLAAKLDTAYFASGCFWCSEAVFERVKGVEDVMSGYAGGTKKNPTYHQVGSGQTNYAESIRVAFNPEEVSYETLLHVFFGSHDPTTLNRQGPDVGKQYRSAIFYTNNVQKATAEKIKKELNASEFDGQIVTEITKYTTFYEAEGYHQGYYNLHPDDPYVRSVSTPKVKKFMKHFHDLLKDEYK